MAEATSKCTTVWDPSHTVQLIFKHALADSPVVLHAKSTVGSFIAWARSHGLWERMLTAAKGNGEDPVKVLRTLKPIKTMKFVQYDTAITKDFLRNRQYMLMALDVSSFFFC